MAYTEKRTLMPWQHCGELSPRSYIPLKVEYSPHPYAGLR
jgi:hypothetical protein